MALRVYVVAPDEKLSEGMTRAFAYFKSVAAVVCAIVLPPNEKLGRDLVQSIADGVQHCKQIRRLGLVHSSPVVGFIAASSVLLCPSVEIRSFASEQSLREAWPDRDSG